MQLPYFYDPSVYLSNNIFTLGEETSRHCVQVLRMKAGEKLQLTNGRGSLYTATIVSADKKHCGIRVEETHGDVPATSGVCIAVSLLKNAARFEWFLEKATEIGVREIVPLLCTRTEKQHYKADRFQNIVISAMLQSRQVWLPVLHLPTAFETVVKDSQFTQKLIAHCIDNQQKNDLNSLAISPGGTQMLIGPEGDFTVAEIELALHHHYQPVSLGSTRLRTETAGVVASALLIHSPKTGDF